MTDEINNPADESSEPVEKAEAPTEEATEVTPANPPEIEADVVVESTIADAVETPVPEPEPEPEPEPDHEVEPVAEIPSEPEPESEPVEVEEVEAESLDAITAVVASGAEAVAETIDTPVAVENAPPIDEPAPAPTVPPEDERKRWYVVKVQSGREESIKAAIERRMRIEALEHLFGQIVIPTEKISVRKKVTERKKVGNEYQKVSKEKIVFKYQKKFPGYLMAFVEYNDEILSLFRGTSGVGDFVGGTLTRAPTPMTPVEIEAMLRGGPDDPAQVDDTIAPPALKFGKGDRVKVRDGIFAGLDGEVKEVVEAKDAKDTTRVKIELMIFGRPTSVELEHWQVDPV